MKKSNDVKRLEEITKVILKNDLKSGISPSKVCNILTELGPTFIKIGQILSTRIDLIPKEYCAALSNLRNNTSVMSRDELDKILKEEYDDYKKVFKSVDECIGAASISEVYKGTLINGDTVAIKVCKNNVYEKMQNDVSLMKRAIKVLHLNKIIKIIDLNKALDEMLSSAYEESNFNIEKDHLIKFKKLNDNDYVTSPKVYSNISTNKVLVMEYVKGVSLDEKDALIKEGCNLENLSYILSDNYIKQALDDGFFHADPHPDNIMVRDNKIVFIDLGMMGTLKEKNKKLLNDAIEKIIEEDYYELSKILVLMCTKTGECDMSKLKGDVSMILSEVESQDLKDIDIAKFSSNVFKMLRENNLVLDKDITMLIRGILVMESSLKNLNDNLSLLSVLTNHIVNKKTSLLLAEKLKGQIEVLPVNVDGNTSNYYFINVLNTVDALNIESKSNEEILKMMRDNNGIFNKGNIGSYIIFRDSLFNNNYYCTDEFIDFVKQYSITGLKFTCAGIAK